MRSIPYGHNELPQNQGSTPVQINSLAFAVRADGPSTMPETPPDQFIRTQQKPAQGRLNLPDQMVRLEISPDGVIHSIRYQDGKPLRTQIGLLKGDGSFELESGLQGNILDGHKTLVVLDELKGPLGDSIQAERKRIAMASSDIPWIRSALTQQGLDGSGIQVGLLEGEIFDKGVNKTHPHTFRVQSVVNHPETGVAPGAQTRILGMESVMNDNQLGETTLKEIKEIQDPILRFNKATLYKMVNVLNKASNRIEMLVQEKDPSLRVVNISWGLSRVDIVKQAFGFLHERDPQGQLKHPEEAQRIFGTTDVKSITMEQREQRLVDYIDQLMLSRSQELSQASHRYQNVTRRAAQSGLTLVVAVGNTGNQLLPTTRLKAGAQLGLLAMSDSVIVVGNSNTNNTPGYLEDDTVNGCSGSGDGIRWNPTVIAPGTNIRFPADVTGKDNFIEDGTSFSAPYVSGVIAMMLQKNPNLSFSEIKQILQKSALSRGYGIAIEGSGVLNPVWALENTPK